MHFCMLLLFLSPFPHRHPVVFDNSSHSSTFLYEKCYILVFTVPTMTVIIVIAVVVRCSGIITNICLSESFCSVHSRTFRTEWPSLLSCRLAFWFYKSIIFDVRLYFIFMNNNNNNNNNNTLC